MIKANNAAEWSLLSVSLIASELRMEITAAGSWVPEKIIGWSELTNIKIS